MSARMPLLALPFVVLLPFAFPLSAQVTEIEGPIPEDVQQQFFDYLNDSAVTRFSGGTRIPAGARVEGDVAVVGGPIQLGGELTGDLLVVNGDLRLSETAGVGGQVVVVGGAVSGEADAAVRDGIVVYRYPLRYRFRAGRIEPLPTEGFAPGMLTRDLGFGQARFTLRAGPNYNRVEGLPVRLGPVIQTVGSNPLTLETFAIWRSTSGLGIDSDELGYWFRFRQAVGGRGLAFLGASAYDEITPIEGRGLSNAEASLATFLLRRDYRDYARREGWSVFLDLRPTRVPVDLSLAYREEEHRTPMIGNPWSLGNEDRAWRPLPLLGEGRIRGVEMSMEWDSRDEPRDPSQGWWIELDLARQVGGELRLPPVAPGEAEPTEEQAALSFFTRGVLDVRQYARVSPSARLRLRAMGGAAITGGPLPPQFQMALGGEGSLPGHPRFSVDCGARDALGWIDRETEDAGDGPVLVHPGYGCDRVFLFQAEFLGSLPFSWSPIPEAWNDSELARAFEFQPRWSLFLNAGQGWARGQTGHPAPRSGSPMRADIGLGFYMGTLGLHWAYPLNRRDQGVNFFVRLEQRF